MATYGPTPLPAYINSDAVFRTWGQGIAAALAAVGLVKTADTGQINWATVTAPLVVSTVAGYEIYRLSDTLQATAPYFFKIEYGVGTATNIPSLALTTGTSTNGAGTLTGQVGTRRTAVSALVKVAGQTLPVFASGDGSRFALCFSADPVTPGFQCWLIGERTRDATGAYTGDGFAQHVNSGTTMNAVYFGTIPAVGGAAPVDNSSAVPIMSVMAPSVHSTGNGADVAISTIFYFIGKPFYALSVVEVARVDVGSVWGATWTATVLGATHTFLNLLCGLPDTMATTNNANVFWGLLWE